MERRCWVAAVSRGGVVWAWRVTPCACTRLLLLGSPWLCPAWSSPGSGDLASRLSSVREPLKATVGCGEARAAVLGVWVYARPVCAGAPCVMCPDPVGAGGGGEVEALCPRGPA